MRGGYSGRGFGGHNSSSHDNGRYRNPCLTMHQPWASLLMHGIKRVEGRSWPSPITGRLWIHAASKVPDPDSIRGSEAWRIYTGRFMPSTESPTSSSHGRTDYGIIQDSEYNFNEIDRWMMIFLVSIWLCICTQFQSRDVVYCILCDAVD